jgi:hypothetical protein
MEHKSHNFRDVELQKRSHHVVENKESGLGSFVKTNRFLGSNEPIFRSERGQFHVTSERLPVAGVLVIATIPG